MRKCTGRERQGVIGHERKEDKCIVNCDRNSGRNISGGQFRLRAGCPACIGILNAADGTPRFINKLCNARLVTDGSSKPEIITADTAMQAINGCELGWPPNLLISNVRGGFGSFK